MLFLFCSCFLFPFVCLHFGLFKDLVELLAHLEQLDLVVVLVAVPRVRRDISPPTGCQLQQRRTLPLGPVLAHPLVWPLCIERLRRHTTHGHQPLQLKTQDRGTALQRKSPAQSLSESQSPWQALQFGIQLAVPPKFCKRGFSQQTVHPG